jgi:hypothetical protein
MFIYTFLQIEQDRAAVEAALADLLPHLHDLADSAVHEGDRLRMRVGPAHLPSKEVELHVLGEPVRTARETSFPISWRATGLRSAFPRMDADLIVAELGPRAVQLSLRGAYVVPLGAAGRVLDGVVLHRVAEATVKTFLELIAQGVTERIAQDPEQIPSDARSIDPSSVPGGAR